jgi:hypothetical protein
MIAVPSYHDAKNKENIEMPKLMWSESELKHQSLKIIIYKNVAGPKFGTPVWHTSCLIKLLRLPSPASRLWQTSFS